MDVTLSKRRRGRPRGTGKPDGPVLRVVADLLIADPTLKPTTAIKRAIERHNPSTIRRLQVKWKATHDALLEEARQHLQSPAATKPASTSMAPLKDLAAGLRFSLALRPIVSPELQEMMKSLAAVRVPSLRDLLWPPHRT